jgi:hypothetical protein
MARLHNKKPPDPFHIEPLLMDQLPDFLDPVDFQG